MAIVVELRSEGNLKKGTHTMAIKDLSRKTA
jgi:hypothetical protein